jgi:hypothetical protein
MCNRDGGARVPRRDAFPVGLRYACSISYVRQYAAIITVTV